VANDGTPTSIRIFEGSDCNATCIAEKNGSGIFQANDLVVPNVSTGSTYLLQVESWTSGGISIGGSLLVTDLGSGPPDGESCLSPIDHHRLGVHPWTQLLVDSTPGYWFNDNSGSSCGMYYNNDWFFRFTAPCDGDYVVSTTQAVGGTDIAMYLYRGSGCESVCFGTA
jgi:hypothetical protein